MLKYLFWSFADFKITVSTDFLSSGLISSDTDIHQVNEPTTVSHQELHIRESFHKKPVQTSAFNEQPLKNNEYLEQQFEYLLTRQERVRVQEAMETYASKK